MELFWFLIIGLLAGWVAGKLMRGHSFGLAGNLVVGVLGAVIGGYLFDILNVEAYGFVGSLVMAVVGAMVLLFVIGLVKRI
ncbi:MAG: GlsB/YeaQ/YmgE family stress response membrane protein [Nitrospirota bacterium]|jgi:uncharacterized membrane protein YeaQ/YmgE (transglycosylase-associated protein family)